MFDCPEENSHRGEDDIEAVVRIISISVSGLLKLIIFFVRVQFVFSQNILARIPGISVPTGGDENPYMEGQKLPVAAKKGMFWINNNSISTWWEILKQTYSDIHRILLKTIKNIKNFQNRQRNLSFLKKVYILLPRTKLRLLTTITTYYS